MSHVATKWAFDQPALHRDMTPAEWAVLVVLADCHNPANGCFPSQEFICSRINLSDRAARGHLIHLRERGLINWEPPKKRGVAGEWNRYHLAFEADFVPAAPDDQPAESADWPTGNLEHDQPADSDIANRQNATSPIEEPVTGEPVKEPERERAREPEGAASSQPPKPEKAGLTVDEAWTLLAKVWPAFAAQSEALARLALSALTPAERKLAVERVPAFLAFHRETQGKAKLPFLHNYLGEKHRWQTLPQAKTAAAATAERKVIGAFDRAWWWLFFDAVRLFGIALLDMRSVESAHLRKHVRLARSGVGWSVGAARLEEIEAAGMRLVQVPVDGTEFAAWTAAMRDIGVELPRPDKAGWIFVPSEWPPEDKRAALADEADEIMGMVGR